MTPLEKAAAWVSGLSYDDIPERIRAIARHQFLSVAGAIYAGAWTAAGRSIMEAVADMGAGGPCTALPGGEKQQLSTALLQNCSLSMALDYDDYLFMGHTGHSAVLVPLAVAELRGSDTRTILTAQVAANEVAGRLGASVVLGPHNGQMWAHIHLISAAGAASRVLGLGPEETADAMGIALYEPVYPLFCGFMGPQSKVLTAAVPAATGAAAAFLAGRGMTGPRAVLEDPQGFWSHFSFLPMPFMMTGLGSAWVTDTIAFKPYPGCAYIDTAVDALSQILGDFRTDRGRDLVPEEVRGVDVEASLLTVAMDAMSGSYLERSRLSPTNINFSVSLSLAVLLCCGALTGAQFTERSLDENRDDILRVASQINLSHDASMTVAFLRAIDEAIDLKAVLSQFDMKGFSRARSRIREHLSSVGAVGRREAVAAWKSLSPADRSFLRGLFPLRALFMKAPPYDLGSRHLEAVTMPFAARVSVRLRDGSVYECERSLPRGGPGDERRLDVPVSKFGKESRAVMDQESSESALEAVLALEERSPAELCDLLTGHGRPDDLAPVRSL